MGNVIRVFFLLNEKFTNNVEALFNRLKEDDDFDVFCGACESCATDYKTITHSKDVAYYFNVNGIPCEDLYDYEKEEYKDISIYKPDYIFVSTPYDIYRPDKYSSDKLALIGKLCDVEYGAAIIANIAEMPHFVGNMFYKNVYFHFISNDSTYYLSNKVPKLEIEKKFIPVGCLKIEKYLILKSKEGILMCRNFEHLDNRIAGWEKAFPNTSNYFYRIVWKPRWTVQNSQLMFADLESMSNFVASNPNVQLLLLEHPFLQTKLSELGLLDRYNNILNKAGIVTYSDSDFLDVVMDSNCLICEPTSLAAEYAFTGNPIVLINVNYNELNNLGKSIVEKEYVSKSMGEALEIIQRILASNVVAIKRQININLNDNFLPSERIVNVLKNDYKTNSSAEYYKEKALSYFNDMETVKDILTKGYYSEGLVEPSTTVMRSILSALANWSQTIIELKNAVEKEKTNKKTKFFCKSQS